MLLLSKLHPAATKQHRAPNVGSLPPGGRKRVRRVPVAERSVGRGLSPRRCHPEVAERHQGPPANGHPPRRAVRGRPTPVEARCGPHGAEHGAVRNEVFLREGTEMAEWMYLGIIRLIDRFMTVSSLEFEGMARVSAMQPFGHT